MEEYNDILRQYEQLHGYSTSGNGLEVELLKTEHLDFFSVTQETILGRYSSTYEAMKAAIDHNNREEATIRTLLEEEIRDNRITVERCMKEICRHTDIMSINTINRNAISALQRQLEAQKQLIDQLINQITKAK